MTALDWLDRVQFHRLGAACEAGLLLTSLPWPEEAVLPVSMGGRATSVLPLGRWPESGHPRRLLLAADGGEGAPEEIALKRGAMNFPGGMPEVSMELFEECDHPLYAWERHLLCARFGSRSVGLALGLRTQGEIHWWEACGMTIRSGTPGCLEVEMAGSIPCRIMTPEEFIEQNGYHNTYLHKHNWLSGHIYARLYANGVCEIFARHTNNRFVDDGRDFEDVVPVIGFAIEEGGLAGLAESWTGDRNEITLDGVRVDVSEMARLARPEQPGRVERQGRFLVLQPYEGVELYGGVCPETLTGDPFIFHSEQHIFPKGMSRTLRFSLSLSDRSPRVARYLAPAWWYGLCEEFLPEPLLPTGSAQGAKWDQARQWIQNHIVRGGFEDGSVPRNAAKPRPAKGRPRNEPGWEGEMPYAQFLCAWRSGDTADYEAAMRSAYHFSDVVIDHASKLVRMHGYRPVAFSLPMNRLQGTLAAYLETGDPFLLEAARAVTANAHWQHRNSWPRMAVGRDACYVRSAAFLYRYTGEDFYRRIALEGALDTAHSQRPDGSFGDQGGGAGIHQWSGYISKPWMGLLAVNGMLDCLAFLPEEETLRASVKKFADWLMAERWEYQGVKVWGYQHGYRGGRDFFNPLDGTKHVSLPTPKPWRHESLARLMAYCTLTFGDEAYIKAWAESCRHPSQEWGDHSISAILQFLPGIRAKMENTPPAKSAPPHSQKPEPEYDLKEERSFASARTLSSFP